jgi:L-ascorbate metabolism protein UlaG (beta-lactamase superfamily)
MSNPPIPATHPLVPLSTARNRRNPFGHPSLEPFRRYEQHPSANGPVTVRFMGVTSLLFQDGETNILSDGFVTRPGLPRIALGRIAPDRERIDDVISTLGVSTIAAVFCGHSHYDHALDAPVFAERTGAVLLGSPDTANVGRGYGLDESKLQVVQENEPIPFGKFELTFVTSRHSPGDRVPGEVMKPVTPPARQSAWKTGITYSVLIRHEHRRILVHGSAGFVPGALRDHPADVIYLGVGGLGKESPDYIKTYWEEVVVATKARRVILVHWDNFFRGLDKPLQPMLYAADDLHHSMTHILRLGEANGVEVLLPILWEPTDPFAGMT